MLGTQSNNNYKHSHAQEGFPLSPKADHTCFMQNFEQAYNTNIYTTLKFENMFGKPKKYVEFRKFVCFKLFQKIKRYNIIQIS